MTVTKALIILALLIPGTSNTDGNKDKISSQANYSEDVIQKQYQKLNAGKFSKPRFELFRRGIIGYTNLKNSCSKVRKDVITLIDFTLSSNKKRLWVIDLKNYKVLYHSLVAHGKNTGNEFARDFSNTPNSNQSSLGFYLTAETYYGKHGLSLRLDGQEANVNDNARKRAIVMHGAEYVDPAYGMRYGRIGRSFGCPAIPMKIHKDVINRIANGSCLFIYYKDLEYLTNSRLQDESLAYQHLAREKNATPTVTSIR